MTNGFQQQGVAVPFVVPKSAATPQQKGRKLIEGVRPQARTPEPRSFR